MLFYLIKKGETIDAKTVLQPYDLNVPELGSMRKTLTVGNIIEIDDELYEVYDYIYSNIHNKGAYVITPYVMQYYKAVRSENLDVEVIK
ncbi:hypothetical protein MHB40_14615 [Lysinibacillus sp. FSL K6-0057]|uniref:hypothetical protein n=1 Tax=Lysinibacillus sp. FSL K6-0057 TaxID=2921411 RepID=UPI00315A0CD4